MQQSDTGANQNTKICNDSGSTNRVECRCRPCTYAIVKCTTEEVNFLLLERPGLARRGRKRWRMPVKYDRRAVGRDQDTADLAAPDRMHEYIARVLPGITRSPDQSHRIGYIFTKTIGRLAAWLAIWGSTGSFSP